MSFIHGIARAPADLRPRPAKAVLTKPREGGFDTDAVQKGSCPMRGLDFFTTKLKEGTMMDPTPNEKAAAMNGGQMLGEYIDSIGKTDIARLTPEEWEQACLCFAGGYTEKLAAFDEFPY